MRTIEFKVKTQITPQTKCWYTMNSREPITDPDEAWTAKRDFVFKDGKIVNRPSMSNRLWVHIDGSWVLFDSVVVYY